MAGAGQPWYMPGLWPVGHVTSALSRPNDEKAKEPSTKPIVDFKDAAATATSGFRAFVVAYFCMFKLYDEENPYSENKTFEFRCSVFDIKSYELNHSNSTNQ